MVSIFVVAHGRAPERIRTSDPRLRRPLLYPPELLARASHLVGASRFERPTTCAQGRCASRLRYAPSKVTRLPNTDSRPHATLARPQEGASRAPSARAARARWLTRCFSAGGAVAKEHPSSSATNTGS